MSRFQAFNLAATRDNGFSSEAPLSAGVLAKVGVDLVRRGMVPFSAKAIGDQLLRERLDHRYKARRSNVQVLPSFDLYWRLHRQHRPHLSVFFTNHVAAMMHRFWGDGMPGYTDKYGYSADPVFGRFILDAMDIVDRQLGRVLRYAEHDAESVLVIAASMGQGPVRSENDMSHTLVLEDVDRLIAGLLLNGARPGLAMYPRTSLEFQDTSGPSAAAAALGSVRSVDGQAMFRNFEVSGRTLSFNIHYESHAPALEGPLTFLPHGHTQRSEVLRCDELGIVSRPRLGGGNTAYHIPDGMLLAYGPGIGQDPSRRQVNILDVAPSLLANLLGVEPAASMRGASSLFN
jgi:hypothetical protein